MEDVINSKAHIAFDVGKLEIARIKLWIQGNPQVRLNVFNRFAYRSRISESVNHNAFELQRAAKNAPEYS